MKVFEEMRCQNCGPDTRQLRCKHCTMVGKCLENLTSELLTQTVPETSMTWKSVSQASLLPSCGMELVTTIAARKSSALLLNLSCWTGGFLLDHACLRLSSLYRVTIPCGNNLPLTGFRHFWQLMGRNCSYLLPRQDGGTNQI